MWSHLRNQRSKQTNLVRFTISFKLCTLFQKLVQKVVKKGTSNMKVYYIIPLNYRLTGHPENFKIKLYYFQETLTLRYNIILKFVSLYNYVSSEITNFQKDLFFNVFLKTKLLYFFSILSNIVSVINYSHI